VIELRQRVLKTGMVILEYRDEYPYLLSDNPVVVEKRQISEWRLVPYVDEHGEPLRTKMIDGTLYIGD